MSINANTDATRAHVDAETLAAWADHGLSAETAAAVELHLSNCDRCQEMLAAFVRSAPQAGAVVIPFWARRPVQWSAAGLAAAAALVAMIWIGRPPAPPAPVSTVAYREVAPAAPAPVDQITPPSQQRQDKQAPAADDKLQARSASRRAEEKSANQALAKKAEGRAAALPPPAAVAAPAVAAPPPPPPPPPAAVMPPTQPVTVSGATPVVTLGRSVAGPPARSETVVMDAISAIALTIEIAAPDPSPSAMRSVAGGAGRGGAGARALTQAPGPTRWRIVAGTHVERTVDAGATWTALPIEPALKTPLLAGSATSPLNCWLVGREGVVLVTNDGLTFRRVSVPEAVHLTGVKAQDGLRATVTAIDGRTFTTIDGGQTWK